MTDHSNNIIYNAQCYFDFVINGSKPQLIMSQSFNIASVSILIIHYSFHPHGWGGSKFGDKVEIWVLI